MGEQLVVRSMSGVMVNNAKVVTADVGATNGVVHIIDHVLVPPGFPETVYPMNIVELAEGQPDLATLVTAVVAGKLAPTLAGNGPFTVFAPTNKAFAKIPTATLRKLLADTAALDKVLEYHVLSGHFSMRDLMAVKKAQTLEGGSLSIMNKGGIQVNNAKVLKADRQLWFEGLHPSTWVWGGCITYFAASSIRAFVVRIITTGNSLTFTQKSFFGFL